MAAEIVVEFDAGTQSLDALNAAAYRFARTAACHIDKNDGRYICRLAADGASNADEIRAEFFRCVTDENVREAMRARTEPVRNLILSLAFGSLASQSEEKR